MKIVFILFILFSNLLSSSLILDRNFDSTYASRYMRFFHDYNSTFNISQLNHVPWQSMHSSNLSGAKEYPSWTKLDILNNTDKYQEIYLKNPRAGMDEVDVYILRKESQQIIYLGDRRPLDLREIPNNHSVFKLQLSPHENVKIVTRLVNQIGSTEGEWIVYSEKSFYKNSFLSTIWWGIFAGSIFALTFYAIPILLAAKDRIITAFFLLYIVSSLGYQFSVNGFLYLFGCPPKWINFFVLFTAISFGFFGILFIIRYLRLEKHKSIIYTTALFFAGVLFLEYIILFVALFDKKIMSFVGSFNVYVGLIAYAVWFAMLRYLILIIKDKIFRYLFTGYTIVIIAYAMQALVSAGLIKMNLLSIYGVSIATLFEIIFFVLGIQEYIHQLQTDQKRKNKLIDFQMQFASIGRVIGNIVHQWKIPLVRTGSLLTQIESLVHFEFESEHLHKELREILPKCRSNLAFMSQTVNEFYYLYSTPVKCEIFSISQTIHDIWDMLAAKALSTNAKITITDPLHIHAISYAHSFSHIIMIILDNALNIAESRKIRTPHVHITITVSNDMINVMIKDNCNGIEQTPIESIFEIDVSNKAIEGEVGGLGLPMAKLLVEERMKGELSVENLVDGACFTIIFPNQKSVESQ